MSGAGQQPLYKSPAGLAKMFWEAITLVPPREYTHAVSAGGELAHRWVSYQQLGREARTAIEQAARLLLADCQAGITDSFMTITGSLVRSNKELRDFLAQIVAVTAPGMAGAHPEQLLELLREAHKLAVAGHSKPEVLEVPR